MSRSLLTGLAIALLAIAGGIAWWATRAPEPAPPAEIPRIAEPSAMSGAMPAPRVAAPRHLRRLLATRLGQPKYLRIERVRTSRVQRYSGVACGHVAWGDDPVQAPTFKRFVATKRSVHIEGREARFDALWSDVCGG